MRHLSTVEIDDLYRLARQKSVEGRTTLTQVVSDLFDEEGRDLTARERSLMFDILHRVIRDVEMSVRKRVSAQIATIEDTPLELVRLLANDTIEVAYPVLVRSRILRDADLIGIIRNRTLEHQLAVAIRQDLSETVADALFETGEENVICTLLRNRDASISRATMECLVEQSRRVDTFREPILQRRELGEDLARRMFMWVSAALRQTILERFEMDQETLDDLLEQAVMKELEGQSSEDKTPSKSRELADRLIEAEEVTPELLLAVLEEGEIPLFLSVFERLTGLSQRKVLQIVFEDGGEGLTVACKASGLPKVTFSSIFSLTRRARPQLRQRAARDLRRALGLYDQMTREAAQKVLRMWQRDIDYLTAIRELEIGC